MTVATQDETQPQTSGSPTKLPVSLRGPLEGLDEAYRMAQALAQSGLMPDTLRNKPNDVLVTVLYGRELDLGPMQALQSIHVIKGKPFISGQLWLSLVRRAGHSAEVSGDEKAASCTITRGDTDETHTETFTLEQAKTAKLTGQTDSNWSKYPDRMLRWRAVVNCARMICPEVALGFQAVEERDDEAEQKPTLAQVASQRVDTRTGEVHDAEVVPDDDAVRAEVAKLEQDHAEPSDEDIAEMNAEAARANAEREAEQQADGSGLFS